MVSKRKYLWVITFIVLFTNCVLASHFMGITNYIYDSEYYWNVAGPILRQGKIVLSNYPETFRGCLFPIMILFFKVVFRGVWGWRIISALLTASCFGLFLPVFFNFHINTLKNILRIVFAETLFLYIWGNYLQYPLSDFAAFCFLLAGITLLKHTITNASKDKAYKIITLVGSMFVCGILFYTSYNTRAAYIYALPLVIIYLVRCLWKYKRYLLIALVSIIFGAAICSLPQCIVNSQYVAFSPKVYTEQYSGYSKSLQMQQVVWGLGIQRYESYIGDANDYPFPAVYFSDKVGKKICSQEKISVDSFSMKDFVRISIKYPLDILGIYTRHFISLSTPAWNKIYIDDLYTNKSVVFILSFLMWLIAIIDIVVKGKPNRVFVKNIWLVIAMVVPGILQLFGAPELRFFIALYCLLYGFVFIKVDYTELYNYIKTRWIKVLLISIMFFALWNCVYGDTLSDNEERVLIINDSHN